MNRIDVSYKRISSITWPVLVTQLTHTAMGVIDTIMVGHLGLVELAAVGLGNLVAWWILAFFWGLFAGVNTLVAQAIGAGRPKQAGRAYGQGLWLAGICGILLAMSSMAAPIIIGWTGAGSEVSGLAANYMRIRLLGGVGFTLMLAGDNLFRGLGRTRIPMMLGLAQLVLNSVFNYFLIFGHGGLPRLGTAGAAIGTVVAQAVIGIGLFATAVMYREIAGELGIRSGLRLRLRLMAALLKLSLPIGVQVFMEMGGVTVFTALVARLGTNQLAATNAVIQAWSLAYMGGFALSVGATTLVGQSVGAGRPARARIAVRRILKIGYVYTAVTGLIYILVPAQIMAIFVSDADLSSLIPYARPLFTIVVLTLAFDLIFNVLSGALRGAGDTSYAMWVNIGSAWLVFVPATLWATPRFGVVGAWSCFVLHTGVMAALLAWRIRGGAWLHRSTRNDQLDRTS